MHFIIKGGRGPNRDSNFTDTEECQLPSKILEMKYFVPSQNYRVKSQKNHSINRNSQKNDSKFEFLYISQFLRFKRFFILTSEALIKMVFTKTFFTCKIATKFSKM